MFCDAGPDINVEIPKDLRVRFLIDSLASYVVSDGCRFEMAAMSAQGANPEFAFLFDLRSSEHAYYRCHPLPPASSARIAFPHTTQIVQCVCSST